MSEKQESFNHEASIALDQEHQALQRIAPAPMALAGVNIEALLEKALTAESAVEVLERLMVMRREMKAEAAKEAFDSAMAGFQSECPVIRKETPVHERNSNKVRYSYAQLDSIVTQVKPYMQKYGLSHRETAEVEEKQIERRDDKGTVHYVTGGFVTAICRVIHSAGHSEESRFKIPIDPDSYMNAAQKFASALTFAKRYAFCNAMGILTGDQDDDSGVSGDPGPSRPAARTAAPAQQSRPATQQTAAPAQQPAGKPANVTSADKPLTTPAKFATATTRDWAIRELTTPGEGSPATVDQMGAFVHEFLVKSGCLLPNESINAWPLRFVPVDKAQLAQLRKAIVEFENGDEAKFPFYNVDPNPPEPEKRPSVKATAADKAKAIEVPRVIEEMEKQAKAIEVPREGVDPNSPDAPWRTFKVPFGPTKGTDLCKIDKNKLFGWWANYTVAVEWQGKPLTKEQIAANQAFRDALDEAGKHYDFRKRD